MPYAFYLSPQESTDFPKSCLLLRVGAPLPPEGTRSHPLNLKSAASLGDFTRFGKVCFQLRWWVFPPCFPASPLGSSALLHCLNPTLSSAAFTLLPRVAGGGWWNGSTVRLPAWVLVLQLTELRVSSRFESQPIRKLTTGKKKNTIACAKPKIA